ncbi:MAG TPA: hypothetical protein VGC97_08070 [Pyrinomonadaceae bacterium]|jgi:hypothetical protein
MSLQKQQNLLARLYTDAEFRRAFLTQPAEIGAEFGLNKAEIDEIAAVLPEELEFFADSLFWKRLREAEKFLPLTKRVLEADFTRFFREFSQNFNPQTLKKHFEDALAFTRFLQKQEISKFALTAAKFEHAKLEFFGFEKRLTICRLDFDPREFAQSEEIGGRKIPARRKKIAVWLRIGKRIRHFFI